jgi:outer membrane protein OmpA-like peptidoglycan-associated protein
MLAACGDEGPPLAKPPFRAVDKIEFTVYFGSNDAVLSDEALATLAKAAEAYKRRRADKLVVTGHTDTVGTPEANRLLSQRRAEAVKSALVGMGLPAEKISTSGRGEEALAVQTGEGVAEGQNRRVEISLQ